MKEAVLILENLRSVENTASIFRSADGFGVSKIYLVGTTPAPLDRFGRKRADFSKVALGAEKVISYEVSKSISSVIKELKDQNFQILALEQHPKSIRLKNFQTSKLKNFALIVGSETDGVSTEALEASEAILEIPMEGMKESLNVSVATGIALFHMLSGSEF